MVPYAIGRTFRLYPLDDTLETIILAGGRGTRLGSNKAKPLADIGGRPLLEHLLMILRSQGFLRITLALGHCAEDFYQHFEQAQRESDHMTFSWRGMSLRLVDTGLEADTGGRLGQLKLLFRNDVLVCWADALFNIDLQAFKDFHSTHGRLASMICINPPARFGHLNLSGDQVTGYIEKADRPDDWVSAGVFILKPQVMAQIQSEATSFERDTLPALANQGELMAKRHTGFWQCMDTPSDHALLNQLSQQQPVPWGTDTE